MTRPGLLWPLLLASTGLMFAQINEQKLSALFGPAVATVFAASPGAKLTVNYGPHHEACALTISGSISSEEVNKIVDTLIPAADRGRKLQDLEQCSPACFRTSIYDNVSVSSGAVMPSQRVEPLAYITFTSSDCKPIVSGVISKGFFVEQVTSSGK